MTKEEILKKHFGDDDFESSEYELKSMDEYAQQVAIEFAEWLRETNWAEKETWGKHDPPSIPTMLQLFNLFIQDKK